MKSLTIAATVLALAPATLFAQSNEPLRGDLQVMQAPILKLNLATVKGTITLSGSHMLVNPGASDACANITVKAYQLFQDGFNQTTKDVAPPVKATGDIKTLKCSYVFPGNVSAGKSIYVGAYYTGPLAQQADSNGGTNGPFTPAAGGSYTRNINLVFTQLQ